MSASYFDWFPPELFPFISRDLPLSSLASLVLSSRRIHSILQPEIDQLIPDRLREILVWAALESCQWTGALEVARLLLEAGADRATEKNRLDYEGLVESHQPIHLACGIENFDMLELLLAHGANVDAIEHVRLIHAIQRRDASGPEIIQMLEHGANPNVNVVPFNNSDAPVLYALLYLWHGTASGRPALREAAVMDLGRRNSDFMAEKTGRDAGYIVETVQEILKQAEDAIPGVLRDLLPTRD
ncbi:hypothetical protein C8F01DRAFT_1365898 [Mycena amicta]|nr:hypothetical protein C8F01DRAFT_1365898 [Mycena amicta]